MPEWTRWILAALCCYRLANLLTIDDGPGKVFFRLRARVGAYDRNQRGEVMSSLGQLFACPYCMAIWTALPCVALAFWPTLIGDLFLAWLGLAGAQDALQGPRHPK